MSQEAEADVPAYTSPIAPPIISPPRERHSSADEKEGDTPSDGDYKEEGSSSSNRSYDPRDDSPVRRKPTKPAKRAKPAKAPKRPPAARLKSSARRAILVTSDHTSQPRVHINFF
jgi:hypothetical protein